MKNCNERIVIKERQQIKEYEIAKLIRELMPSMEMTRMVSSGTESVMSAITV